VNSVPFSSEFKTECCKLTNVLALYHCYYTHEHIKWMYCHCMLLTV